MSKLKVHLVLMDDPSVKKLNRRWLGKIQATDVLAFP